jgi:hypothetical protein
MGHIYIHGHATIILYSNHKTNINQELLWRASSSGIWRRVVCSTFMYVRSTSHIVCWSRFVLKRKIFWDVTPNSSVEASLSTYFLGLLYNPEKEAVCSSEILMNFYSTIQNYIPEKSENFKANIGFYSIPRYFLSCSFHMILYVFYRLEVILKLTVNSHVNRY